MCVRIAVHEIIKNERIIDASVIVKKKMRIVHVILCSLKYTGSGGMKRFRVLMERYNTIVYIIQSEILKIFFFFSVGKIFLILSKSEV